MYVASQLRLIFLHCVGLCAEGSLVAGDRQRCWISSLDTAHGAAARKEGDTYVSVSKRESSPSDHQGYDCISCNGVRFRRYTLCLPGSSHAKPTLACRLNLVVLGNGRVVQGRVFKHEELLCRRGCALLHRWVRGWLNHHPRRGDCQHSDKHSEYRSDHRTALRGDERQPRSSFLLPQMRPGGHERNLVLLRYITHSMIVLYICIASVV